MITPEDTLTHAVRGAVLTVIRSPDNPAPPEAAEEIATQVVAELRRQPAMRDALARPDHAGGARPWYQSRVTLGALVALIGGAYSLGLDIADGTPPSVDSLSSQLTAILGAAAVLSGGGRTKRRP
ncbi:hypothetical protein J2X65_003572 [Ancylobacter sp. 3268]|uniref:hypothetical protein n=1 Tax=Ancylobacter sp. 3268 TaxID=2817752 RepID=UPI002859AC3E|nr:hypothetical protein [Ancylobacter sp. 3268]MDR6954204.1 hypothetical protein [Ancylobacter sp. 3268]